jgi:2-dehydro-3-deoxygalactonokinase
MERFLSCDWGTSTFRLRLADAVQMYAEVQTNDGILNTHQQWLASGRPETERTDFYREKLSDAINHLSVDIEKNIPVILSGMASSSIGMEELPYRAFPFNWDIAQFPVRRMNGNEKFPHPLYLVSGFKTDNDIMRGEESLLLGCDIEDDDERLFIFPGTHSKHVFVKNKSALDFKTYMTGEFFSLLAEKSILRHAVKKGSDEQSFSEGVSAGLKGNVLHQAFLIRTRQLLHQVNPVSGYQFLSGLLVGTELSQLKGIHCPVYVVCNELLKGPYLSGLKLMDFDLEVFFLNADDILLKGHRRMANHFLKQ